MLHHGRHNRPLQFVQNPNTFYFQLERYFTDYVYLRILMFPLQYVHYGKALICVCIHYLVYYSLLSSCK